MKLKTLLLFIGLITSLTSCMFTEEIYINNNGSGKYAFKIDMSEMMRSMGEMSPNDSLKESKVLDTIIFFKDILEENKDSIAALDKEDKEIIEDLKDLKLHMQVDEEKGKMLLDFKMDFNNISELKNMEQKIAKAQALSEKKKKKDKSMPSNSDVSYSFKGKTFSRKVTLKDVTEEQLNEIKEASAFLEGGLYKIIYHFESEIKSVSFKGAKLSNDKKTMTIEVPMDSIIKNQKLLDFEVKLK
ncbi:MAG: hypothetical protein L3J20_02660 [Flavobacteriaceae bacterium]|nr:hypothetical protein [Flavobacteriaceae bacterium]